MLDAAASPDPVIRERILAVSAELFAEHGYDAVSLREICEAARVSKGAIYHHFASKEDLLAAIVISSLEELLDHVGQPQPPDITAADRLRAFICGQAELAQSRPTGFRVAMSRFASLGAAKGQVEALRRAYVRSVRRIFTDGVESGEFRSIDIRAATRMVLAILYWLARWYEPGGGLSAVDIAAAHADLMLNGMRAP